jgi:hypothetical protein
MLKKGLTWHYTAYDRRPELAKVCSIRPLIGSVRLTKSLESSRAPFEHFSNHIYTWKGLNELKFMSVGEPGASERAGTVGATEPWEAMGMEEGEAHEEMVSQSAVTCDHEELKTGLVWFDLLRFSRPEYVHQFCTSTVSSCCNSWCRVEQKALGVVNLQFGIFALDCCEHVTLR